MDLVKTEHDSDEEGQSSCTGSEYWQSDTKHEDLTPFTFCAVKSEPEDAIEDIDIKPESDDGALSMSPLDDSQLKLEDALEVEIKSDVDEFDSDTEIPSISSSHESQSKLERDVIEMKSSAGAVVLDNKRPFLCDVCNKTFTDLRNLKRHQSIHTDTSSYVCVICNKSFKRLRNLKRHERIHTGERPHSCDICNKSFTQLPHLTRHQRIHTGKHPYLCDVCKKSFSQLWNLKMHQHIHTGARPYLCDICNKGFTMPSHVKRHQLKVHWTGEHPS